MKRLTRYSKARHARRVSAFYDNYYHLGLLVCFARCAILSIAASDVRPTFAPPELFVNADTSPHIVTKDMARFMRRCIHIAKANKEAGKAPYGALIVDPSTEDVVVEGRNHADIDPIWHGEMDAIRALSDILAKTNETTYAVAPRLDLYTTAEPCPMCAAAIVWAGFRRVVYGTSIEFIISQKQDQINIRAIDVVNAGVFHDRNRTVVVGGVLRNETDPLYVGATSADLLHGFPHHHAHEGHSEHA